MSLTAKVVLLLALQSAGTLISIGGYYSYLTAETRGVAERLQAVTADAKRMHRRIDNKAPLGAAGRQELADFVQRVDAAGSVLGTVPPELRPLLDEISAQWKRTKPALLRTAAGSDESDATDRQQLHSVFPYWQSAGDRMQKSLALRQETIGRQMTNTFALAGSVDLVFLAAVLLLVRRFIRTPIRAVHEAATRVAAGDYSTDVPVLTGDEIGALAAEFNRMRRQLHEAVESLRTSEHDLAEKASALERSKRELEQYAFAAAHDLQEPARLLKVYSQLLSRRFVLPDEAREVTSQIEFSAERMQSLVKDLLAHSQAVHEPAEIDVTDAGAVLQTVLGSMTEAVEAAGATIVCEPLPWVRTSEDDLAAVFRHLLSNALKYRGNSSPVVDIWAESSAEFCTFSVRDNGVGVPPEHQERVFGLFRRLHGPSVPGTGVGLSIARNVVEKYGGQIWVESEPGQGATFRFRLPPAGGSGSAASA